MGKRSVAIIGAGRMGQGLGLALVRQGYTPVLVARTTRTIASPLRLQVGELSTAAREAEVILVATPDDQIAVVAAELARAGAVRRHQIVLHLSGLLDRRALAALYESGAGLGSFHPLQTVSEPSEAPERLQGAYVGIEGDDQALSGAEWLAADLGMLPVRIPAQAKPAYHVGATLVANYTVTLMGIAERLARNAGVPEQVAAKIYLPLLAGAVQNIAARGPAAALTGAIRRGDVHTIEAHLAALERSDQQLYRRLGLAALDMARGMGLEEQKATEVERVLRSED